MSKEKSKNEFEVDYKIVNIVATVSLKVTEKLDLTHIARKLIDVMYARILW